MSKYQSPMMEPIVDPIFMNPFSPLIPDAMSELMGSVPIRTMPNETAYVHHEFNGSTLQQAPTYRELLIHDDPKQPCLFLNGVTDNCYQSRLLVRVLEYYFVDNDPNSFKNCRCPMENCPRQFIDPKHMFRHLKNCEFLKQGFIRCPECKEVEAFRTSSEKSCSWRPRPSFRHRAHRKLRAALDIIKQFASSQPDSFPLGKCKNCGHAVKVDGLFPEPGASDHCPSTSQCFESSSAGGHDEKEGCYELFTSELWELPAYNRKIQPSPISHEEFDSSPYTVSDQSPLSNFPSELASSPISRGTIRSIGPSPIFTESTTTLCTDASQNRSSLTNGHQYFKSASVDETILNSGHMGQMQNNWKRPQSTQQQRQSLSIQTSHLGQKTSNIEWENFAFYTKSTPDPMGNMGSMEQLDTGGLPPSISMSQTPPIPNIGTYVHPSVIITDGNTTPNIMPPVTPSPLDPAYSPLSTTKTIEPELSEDELCCPHCSFKPSGKEQNHRAYLRKHISTHENMEFKCEICNKPYTRRDNMVVHRRAHYRKRDSSPDLETENQRRKRASYSK